MTASTEGRDGRTVRAERTHKALVESLLGLLDEGRLRPTAAEIAERAEVSERSVFQHFPDREALFEAVAREQYERVVPTLRPVDASLALPERIEEFAGARCRLLERIAGVRRAALIMESESEVVAGWLASVRRSKAAELERVFRRELEATAPDEREVLRAVLVATGSWTFYESLRYHQGLSANRARNAVREALTRLLIER